MRNRTEIYLVVRNGTRDDHSSCVISAHSTIVLADEAAGRAKQKWVDSVPHELRDKFMFDIQQITFYNQ